jgi:hypothetical protein
MFAGRVFCFAAGEEITVLPLPYSPDYTGAMNAAPVGITKAFDSANFHLRDVRANLDSLNPEVQAFITQNPYREVIETDPKTGNKTYKLVGPHSVPDKIRSIAVSTIYNLRHTLDQVACAAYEVVTKKSAPDKLYFPKGNGRADFEGQVKKNFPNELFDVLMRSENYPSAQGVGGNDFICGLFKAAHGKHRVSCNIGATVHSVGFDGLGMAMMFSGGVRPFIPPRRIEGTNDFMLAITKPHAEFQFNGYCEFVVCLDNAGPFTGDELITTLDQLFRIVAAIVGGIQSECVKIAS